MPGLRLVSVATIVVVLAVLMLAGCKSPVQNPEQRYELKGRVVLVDKRDETVSVAHAAIPGYMEAMTMPFKLKDEHLLNDLAEGDHIQATLVVAGTRSWLENVIATRETALPAGSVGATTTPGPALGVEVPDFSLTNQNGKAIHLGEYRGKVVVITFIYTRCPLPDYCPLMTTNFSTIDNAVRQQSANYPPLHLLSVTVDPAYDKPAVLRDYGASSGADFGRWEFAGGSKDEVKKIATYFGMSYWNEGDQIVHSLRTAIIDSDGKLVKLFTGNDWKPDDVLSELRSMKTYHGAGTVEALDRDAATIQINHGDIPGLMPAMDMPFQVDDKSLFEVISVGDKVEFSLRSGSAGLIVTSIKKL